MVNFVNWSHTGKSYVCIRRHRGGGLELIHYNGRYGSRTHPPPPTPPRGGIVMIKEGFIDMHQTQAMVCCLREQIASNVREWLARPRTLAELYGITQAISHHFLVFTHHVHNICKEEDDAIKRETQAMLNQLSISWKCMDTKCSPAARPVTTRFKAPLTNTVRTPYSRSCLGNIAYLSSDSNQNISYHTAKCGANAALP